MTRSMVLWSPLFLAACGGGLPDLAPYDVGGAVVWAPVGWTVSVDPTGQVISMEDDPSDDETASVVVQAGRAGGASAGDVKDAFVDLLETDGGFRDLTIEHAETSATATASEFIGLYGDTPASVGLLTLVDTSSDVFLLTAFAGRTADYARYGAMDLVVAVLVGPKVDADAQPGSASWTDDAGDAMGGGFDDMWDQMYGTWSNNIGDDNGWCWGDDAGCL